MTQSGYSICVPTFRRPKALARLLQSIADQEWLPALERMELVVVDNDEKRSAASVVEGLKNFPITIRYCVEPIANIAHARNRLWNEAKFDFIVYIDDDQVLAKDWFRHACRLWENQSQDVFAAVTAVPPLFERPIPKWLEGARVYQRESYSDSEILPPGAGRTGGVIVRKSALEDLTTPFDPDLGKTGGEDAGFFERVAGPRRTVVGLSSAKTFEVFPAERCSFGWVLLRNFRIGYTDMKRAKQRSLALDFLRCVLRTAYLIPACPISIALGRKKFLWHAERLSRELGRITCLVGIRMTFY